MDEIKFEEIQKFRQKGIFVIYALLLGLAFLFAFGAIQQIVFHQPFGVKPGPSFVLIIVPIIILTFLGLMYISTLQTLITDKGVFFKWSPFQRAYKQFSWNDIAEAKIINYGSVGFGLRLTPYGTVYNVSGHSGLRIVSKSGKKVVLGTQKPSELTEFLRKIKVLQ